LVDVADREKDRMLARHILTVHEQRKIPGIVISSASLNSSSSSFSPIPREVVQAYIAQAKSITPSIPNRLSTTLQNIFVEMRKFESEQARPTTYTTARSLLSIIRLSLAHARMRLSKEVNEDDISEARRLVLISEFYFLFYFGFFFNFFLFCID
jgi:DNA replication licensing factor MCM7